MHRPAIERLPTVEKFELHQKYAGRYRGLLPLDESLRIMRTLDTIRGQWGLVYPFET